MSKLPHLEITMIQYTVNNHILDSTTANILAMIDTGSTISVINREIVNKYKLKSQKYQKIRISNAVSSLNITTDEVIKCNIKIQNMELVNKTIYIVDELQTALILGMDCLRNLTIQLTHKPSIKIQGQVNRQIEVETHSLNHVVVNKENDIYEINQGKDEINVGSIKILSWEEKILNPHSFCAISVRYDDGKSKQKQ